MKLRNRIDNLGWTGSLNDKSRELLASVWGDIEVNQPMLCSSLGTGHLQVNCGGKAIIAFNRIDKIRGVFYIVIRDDEGQAWEAEQQRARDQSKPWPTRSKPNAALELVFSA